MNLNLLPGVILVFPGHTCHLFDMIMIAQWKEKKSKRQNNNTAGTSCSLGIKGHEAARTWSFID